MTPIEQAREAAADYLKRIGAYRSEIDVREGSCDDHSAVQSHLRAILAAYRRCAEIAEQCDQTGWLIEHGGHSIPTYWTGESWGHWHSDHSRACRFARREDAFKVSLAVGDMPHDPPHKIIEHKWMKP